MSVVLVTGAGGFVGRAVCSVLADAGHKVRPAGRAAVGEIHGGTDWNDHLHGVEAVVHLAARIGAAEESLYLRTNRDGTRALAEAAERQGVRRFVYVSTAKVLGESAARPLTATDPPNPADAYARSKLAGEEAVTGAARRMSVVILRPPLVYGPGVAGNFLALLKWVSSGFPIPFASISNRRSIIARGNLCSAIEAGLIVPAGIYLPADAETVSTPELVRRLAAALNVVPRLWPVSERLMRTCARAVGRAAAADRLLGSLEVDGCIPGWAPPFAMDTTLAETAAWYRTGVRHAGRERLASGNRAD